MTHFSLSSLPHTWIIDLDGTVLKHNGHKEDGDALLEGVREFWERIPPEDVVIFMSAREQIYADHTIGFLRRNGIRYDHIIFGMPKGERILINDMKPSGLITAYAVNVERNGGLDRLSLSCGK